QQMLKTNKTLITATLTLVIALGDFFTVGVHHAKAISLQGDNGQYLSRIRRGPIDAIEVAKPNLDPPFTSFNLVNLPDGKVALKADNGQYLSRIRRGPIDSIEAAKPNLDPPFTSFDLVNLPNGKVAFKSDNGLYWSRIRRGPIDPVEPAKTDIDVFSQFTLVP
ncbi:MAG: fascin domain-containing protein, partial [Dolichospermum sp.]